MRKSPGPSAEQVRALREQVQAVDGIGITAAQDICAMAVFSSRRAWQQWEHGDRHMHQAFWHCACARLGIEV